MGKEVQQISLNLLCEGTELTGDLTAANDIRVDGVIKGNIRTSGRVVIGPQAKVEGMIESAGVDLIGTMEGNIVSTGWVTLRENANFTGNIRSAFISIESGAIFNGECRIERETT